MNRPAVLPALDPATWVDGHGDYLFRFALHRVRNRDAAEELVQETLLAALTARHAFRGTCSERSWLTAILKRKAIDWLRAEVRRESARGPADDGADATFTKSGKWKVKPGEWPADDPASNLSRADFRDALAGCLDRLPRRLRLAFVLRHIDERPADDVGRSVETSVANLWVMLHRARLRLWRCLTVNWLGETPETRSEGRT